MKQRFTLLICLALFMTACGSPEPAPPRAPADVPATDVPDPTDVPAQEEMTETEETAETEETSADFASANGWTEAWVVNDAGTTSGTFEGVVTNIASVSTTTVDGVEYMVVNTSGVPDYEVTIDQEMYDALSTRPLAATDFDGGVPGVDVGDTVAFGENIGYAGEEGCIAPDAGYGYWPNGPVCPADVEKEQYFPLTPTATDEVCSTDLNSIGTWINGVSIFNFMDGQSYNSEGVWTHEALAWEIYDLDICLGHAADGEYHNHSHPTCLQSDLDDDGSAASPIYGFAADGYPIYGPYEDAGVLATSCWKTRDYSADSETGCGADGERTCVLVDQYDISQGVEDAESPGPNTDEYITSMSGNSILAESGAYFEDFYYDPACSEQGAEYLDEHNGHYDDVRGYHYHTTLKLNDDDSFGFAFPHYAGPTYAGVLLDNALASCGTGESSMPGGGPPDGGEGGPPDGGEGGPPEDGEAPAEGEEASAEGEEASAEGEEASAEGEEASAEGEAPAVGAVPAGESSETAEVVSENVEVYLVDRLDGSINEYCLDIAGGNQDVDPANGLQAHTCYSYEGDLGTDQVFDTAEFANNALYMPVYDVCAQVASLTAGSEIGLAACDGSDLQMVSFSGSGTISPASASDLCFTAGDESRTGRNTDHQIRDLTLETCSDALSSLQQWGNRTGLDDDTADTMDAVVADTDTADAVTDIEEVTEAESGEEGERPERPEGGPPDGERGERPEGGPPEDGAGIVAGDADDTEEADATDDATETTETVCDTSNISAQSADPDVEALRTAIVTFRASLSDELLAEGTTCLGAERMILWHNTPANDGNRDGITYGDLSDEQLNLFQEVLQAFLSDDGYQKVYEVTYLAEGLLNTYMQIWDPDFYSIDMFGDPETDGSWGFQLDGHHVAVNFLVDGDNVSIVPAFLGGEPVAGTYEGVDFDILASERDLGLAMYASLTDDELGAAVSDGITSLVVGPADRNGDPDPYIGEYDYSGFETGLKYTDMSADTQANLIAVMQTYVYNMETAFADAWWEDVSANIDDTYFVWSGDGDASASEYPVFYYRIYNPVVWIEYNVESNAGPGVEDGNHGHSIIRVPYTYNDGDYGIFASTINQGGPRTLLEHYANVDHHALSDFDFDYVIVGLSHTHSHDG